MKSLTTVIDDEISGFFNAHNRKPSVIRLGRIHVQTLRACGVVSRERDTPPIYQGIPVEIVPKTLHVSVG